MIGNILVAFIVSSANPIDTQIPSESIRSPQMKDPKKIKKAAEADDRHQTREQNMIEVDVAFISVDASTGTPILFLKEKAGDPKYIVPIWIGPGEATAIQWKLKGEPPPPRPMTHDLMKNIIENLGATVETVFVHSLTDSTYLGQINLQANGKTLEIDARSSDAIALALRFEAPIYVAEQIIQETGFPETELKNAEKQPSKGGLEDLDEETLGRYTV
ncbi:MAG: bifunctional nuclease family protein [Candidatus Poribacteria bacterium]|nr:bifunctional nuclease family protein [Candidatus Poribacteria bacterium]